MTLVVGLFDTLQRAQGAVEDLLESGFGHGAVSVLISADTAGAEPRPDGEGGGPVIESASGRRHGLVVAGPLAASLRAHGTEGPRRVPDVLCAAGLSRFAATYFNEAICDGGVLVAVHCDERCVRDARDILDTHAPDGFDEWSVPFGERNVVGSVPIAQVNGKGYSP
jgi:hypothetical protein